MTWAVLFVATVIIYGLVTRKNRALKNAGTRNMVIDASKKKQITMTDLANKRHNIHTAHNLIALGLVKPARNPLEHAIQDAYDGVFDENNNYASGVVKFFGLHPNGSGFVGF